MSVKPFLLLTVLAGTFSANAQTVPGGDTTLKGSRIEVIQVYKAQVRSAPKPEWIPQLPPADTTHPAFKYEVPQQPLFYTYGSLPLKPLALGKDSAKQGFPNYVKIGGGNLSAIFLDAGIGSIAGPGYETNIHLRHLSQKGKIVNQQSSLSGLSAEGNFHKSKADWHTAIVSERNQYNFFGGDQSPTYPADSISQVYTLVRVLADVQNRVDSNTKLTYHPAISASVYNAKLNANEVTMTLNAPLGYKVAQGLNTQIALAGAFTNYKANTISTNNNFIEVIPGVDFDAKSVKGHALFGFALGKDSKSYFLPDVALAYTLPGDKFVISAGWQALLRQNTYEQLTAENPYMYSYNPVMQTKTSEVFINLNGSQGNHLSFNARAGLWSFNSLPTFLNDIGDARKFYTVYQDVRAFSIQAAAKYHVADVLSVGLAGDYYSFYNSTDLHVWQQPNMKIKADFTAAPVRKLTVTAYLALLGGLYAKDINHNVVKMNMIADLGGNAEYLLIPRLSAFAQVNNLLGTKYQRWYGYQAYGLNIYGGIRFKF